MDPQINNNSPIEPQKPVEQLKRQVMSRRNLLILIVSILILAGGGIGYTQIYKPAVTPKKNSPAANSRQVSSANQPGRIRILAAGDFIAHDSINANAKQADGSYNYLPMMADIQSIFKAADIRFCNDANLNGGVKFGITGYPKFNSPTEFARDMQKVGCNVVNTGTNHSFDKTQAEISASVDAWEALPNTLAVAGQNRNQAEHDAVHYFNVKGIKGAFLAYTTYLNVDAPAQNDYGVNVYSRSFAASQIAAAKSNGAKFIMVSIRWGTEYSPDVTDAQKSEAQYLADQGVNIILGHGSHILEPVETLTGSGGSKTTVWYSLGNFLNTQLPAETLFNGLAVIDLDSNSLEVKKMSFLPIYMHYQWSPGQAAAQDLLARHDTKMYLLSDATQSMIDSQQLKTTLDEQKDRLQKTLNTYQPVPLITSKEYLAN